MESEMKMFKLRFLILTLVLLILLSLGFTPICGQTSTATLSGTVTDANGAAVPGANVTLSNIATGFERKIVTNEEGGFTIPLLPPSNYTLTVARDGFAPSEIRNIVLNVGDQKALALQLKVGPVSGEVTVTPDASLVSTSPAVSTTVDRTFVSNLPLNGRSFQSLILLTPGIVATPTSENTPGEFSVNGQRQNANYFTVDGVSANTGIGSFWDGSASAGFSQQMAGTVPGNTALGTTSSLVSVDALEEFKIQTSTYSAEYGRQPGAQVQLVTRSGTNDFHGSAFDYLRNEKLDANNWFTNSQPLTAQQIAQGITKQSRLPLRQNDFGGTFSGPVMLPRFGEEGKPYWSGRNKTFFFFSYEGQRLLIPVVSNSLQVPSLRLRQIAAPGVQPFLNAWPVPTEPETTTSTPCDPATDPACSPTTHTKYSGAAPFAVSYSNPSAVDAYSIRVDHAVNSKLSLFGRYSYTPSNSLTRTLSELQGGVLAARTLTLSATLIVTPHLNNEIKFNYSSNRGKDSRQADNFGGAVPVTESQITSGYSGPGPEWGAVRLALPFPTSFPSRLFRLGNQSDSYQRQINIVDNVSLIKGAHSLKFGIDWRRLTPTFGPWKYGQFVLFLNEAAITTGMANFVSISAYRGAHPIFNNYSAYVQDTWKLSPRLTVDLGMRWELNPAPRDRDGIRPVLVTGIVGNDVSKATLAAPNAPFYKTFYTAFSPRVGLAYLLNRTGGRETVLRGGFGVYYDLGSGQGTTAFGGFPFFTAQGASNVPFPLLPSMAIPPAFPAVQLPLDQPLSALNPGLKLPYTLQWNVALEQSLGKHQVVSVSYVAAVARNLLTTQVLNQGRPDPYINPRPNPNFGDINYTSNGPSSDYHSMQAQYQRRLSRGFQVLANYTWSHAIDAVSDEVQAYTLERGNADFDVRHNFTAAITYDLPKLHGTEPRTRFLSGVVNGWSLSAIFLARSGVPLDLGAGQYIRPDGTFANVRPDLVSGVPFWIKDSTVPGGQRLNPAAFQTPPVDPNDPFQYFLARQGTLGRNVVRLPGISQVNIAVARQFNLTERLNLQLTAEAFNVFNHPLFGSYDNFVGNTTLGVPQSMLGTSMNGEGAGGLNSLYQIGGPRSIQLSMKLRF
jgi:hypothetical protein